MFVNGMFCCCLAHLHAGAHCKGKLTERSFQNIDEGHGHKNLLSIQNVFIIYQHIHSKHGECNLKTSKK